MLSEDGNISGSEVVHAGVGGGDGGTNEGGDSNSGTVVKKSSWTYKNEFSQSGNCVKHDNGYTHNSHSSHSNGKW